jgi:hypothetical protein
MLKSICEKLANSRFGIAAMCLLTTGSRVGPGYSVLCHFEGDASGLEVD